MFPAGPDLTSRSAIDVLNLGFIRFLIEYKTKIHFMRSYIFHFQSFLENIFFFEIIGLDLKAQKSAYTGSTVNLR